MTIMPTLPPDVRRGADGIELVGGRCMTCSAVGFPRPVACARCTSEDVEEAVLAGRGTLWTWTIQHFAPKAPFVGPEEFIPYAVGYVDLADVLVESRLVVPARTDLRIGMPMMLVEEPLGPGESTFAFTTEVSQ